MRAARLVRMRTNLFIVHERCFIMLYVYVDKSLHATYVNCGLIEVDKIATSLMQVPALYIAIYYSLVCTCFPLIYY